MRSENIKSMSFEQHHFFTGSSVGHVNSLIGSATGLNKINRHNHDLDDRNSILKNGVTRIRVR